MASSRASTDFVLLVLVRDWVWVVFRDDSFVMTSTAIFSAESKPSKAMSPWQHPAPEQPEAESESLHSSAIL